MDPDYEIEVEPYREGRLNVRIVRGRYVTGFDVSLYEAETLIETLRDALSAKEDRREADAPEPLPHWWHQCRKATFSEHVASCRTPESWGDPVATVAAATKSARTGASYVPTPERWEELTQIERRRQVEEGYDAAHDREHGIEHLLRWSQDYGRRGKRVQANALVEAAREQLLSLVVELDRARANGTVFTYGEIQRRLMGQPGSHP